MSSDIATGIPEVRPAPPCLGRAAIGAGAGRPPARPAHDPRGLVWAVAQPYRIVFLDCADRGLYDFLVQPPLLVGLVGVVFALVVAPGLVEDLESEGDGPTA